MQSLKNELKLPINILRLVTIRRNASTKRNLYDILGLTPKATQVLNLVIIYYINS